MTATAHDREILTADPALPEETRAACLAFCDEIDRLHADRDRLREELERQAAEIGRLRNKKQQTCACAMGPAVWCTACMRQEAGSQQARNLELMRAIVATLGSGPAFLKTATRLAETIEQMRHELTKEGVTP
jgi:hypothetical protein